MEQVGDFCLLNGAMYLSNLISYNTPILVTAKLYLFTNIFCHYNRCMHLPLTKEIN